MQEQEEVQEEFSTRGNRRDSYNSLSCAHGNDRIGAGGAWRSGGGGGSKCGKEDAANAQSLQDGANCTQTESQVCVSNRLGTRPGALSGRGVVDISKEARRKDAEEAS